jgi:TIR domain
MIEQCDAMLVVLSAGSLGKQWLNWQISEATQAQQKRDVPIYVAGLDQQVFDIARTVSLLSDLDPTLSTLIGMTWYRSSKEDQQELKRLLNGAGRAATRRLRCFISYSRKRKEFADRLRADLLQVPVAVWKDLEDTPGGAPYRQQIEDALKSSTHVLFLLNRKSAESRFVIDEVDRAQQENKVIIPILEEEVDLPLGFRGTQAISFTDYDSGFRKLLQSLVATSEAKAARAELPS